MFFNCRLTTLVVLLAAGTVAGGADPPAEAKKKEVPLAVLLRGVVLTQKETRRLQLSTKKSLRSAASDNDYVLRLDPVAADPTSILLTAKNPGYCRVTLTDPDMNQEGFLVVILPPKGAPRPGTVVARPGPGVVTVLVARQDIPAGTLIRRPEELFKRVLYMKTGQEPQDAYTDFEQLQGKRTRRALAEDQPVKEKDIAG